MTNKELIQTTWPEHAQRILELIWDRGDPEFYQWYLYEDDEPMEPVYVMKCAFVFELTDEGHDYWWNLATRIQANDLEAPTA